MSTVVVYVHGLWQRGAESLWLRRRLAQELKAEARAFSYPSVTADAGDMRRQSRQHADRDPRRHSALGRSQPGRLGDLESCSRTGAWSRSCRRAESCSWARRSSGSRAAQQSGAPAASARKSWGEWCARSYWCSANAAGRARGDLGVIAGRLGVGHRPHRRPARGHRTTAPSWSRRRGSPAPPSTWCCG